VSITVKILKRAVGGRPTLYATRDLDVLPISIGRDAACTIALEDPNKHMSRFHVEIAEENGTYWMSVVSKVNPVIVKGARYGPGTRLTLQSGDSFELADYEVQVLLPEAAPTAAPPPPTRPAGTEERPADSAERLFNEATFVGLEQPAGRPAPRPEPARPQGPLPEETYIPKQAPKPAAGSHALRALFEGAGLPLKELSPLQVDRMLRDCGAIVRAAVEGIMKLLLARAEMGKEFGAEGRTLVAQRDNNPLMLMSHPKEAIEFLFDPAEDRTDGFLDPVQAIGEACEDIRTHEAALMAGMRAAILGALARFDPAALEREVDKSAKSFSLAGRKAKLWDAFVAQQEKLSREAQDDFNQVFGREFMGAYEAHLRRLKGGR
jgi:predicted component of type VI protein secretion system